MDISGLFPSSGIVRELVVKQLSPKCSGMALTPLLTMPRSQSKRPQPAPSCPLDLQWSRAIQCGVVSIPQLSPSFPPLPFFCPILFTLVILFFIPLFPPPHFSVPQLFPSLPPLALGGFFSSIHICVTQRHPTCMESEVFVYKM